MAVNLAVKQAPGRTTPWPKRRKCPLNRVVLVRSPGRAHIANTEVHSHSVAPEIVGHRAREVEFLVGPVFSRPRGLTISRMREDDWLVYEATGGGKAVAS